MKPTDKPSKSTSNVTLSDPRYSDVEWVYEEDTPSEDGARICYEACKDAVKLIESVRGQAGSGPFLVNFGQGLYERLLNAIKTAEGKWEMKD